MLLKDTQPEGGAVEYLFQVRAGGVGGNGRLAVSQVGRLAGWCEAPWSACSRWAGGCACGVPGRAAGCWLSRRERAERAHWRTCVSGWLVICSTRAGLQHSLLTAAPARLPSRLLPQEEKPAAAPAADAAAAPAAPAAEQPAAGGADEPPPPEPFEYIPS